MKKIRIAFIAGGLTGGGVEAMIYNYCSCLDQNKYELVYITYDKPKPEIKVKFEKLNFIVYLVTKKKVNLLKSTVEVYRILKKHKINIIHSNMTVMSFATSIIGVFCGIKVRIAHAHLAQNIKGIKKVIYWIFKELTKISSTDYFACGKDAAIFLYGKRYVNNGKVKIINNAINCKIYAYNENIRNKLREEYNIKNKFVIGNVARFTTQKNHVFLIDIIKRLYEKNKNIILLAVGDGPLMNEIKEKVKNYGLEDIVIFTGICNNLNEIYQAMDIFLLPSLYEGLPVVLVEAQANGLEIYASDTITREISVKNNIKYLPIKNGIDVWVEEILKNTEYRRCKLTKEIIKAGYDNKTEALELDKFYTDRLKI